MADRIDHAAEAPATDWYDVCPRCGPTILTHVMPTLDGTPVLMCCICRHIDTEDTWKERAQ